VTNPPARRRARARIAASALAALATGGIVLGACSREPPRFVPPDGDSTLVVQADSFALLVADALERWDAREGDAAAPPTARLLLDDLRRHPDRRLVDRARTFLDSCGFGAEVAGSVDVVAANLFSRADPTGGSWPYLFWREAATVGHQQVEGAGMRLLDLAVQPAAAGQTAGEAVTGPQQVAAIFTRSSSRGPQPVVIAWRRPPAGKRWTLAQTLGPDSLGGTGVVDFVAQPGGGAGLEARTYRPTAGFDECPTCPHVHRLAFFEWSVDGFRKTSEEAVPSPYESFVQLIAALSVNDREMALRLVLDPLVLQTAEQYEWGMSKGIWRVAPGTDESSSEMTFFRGRQEAYKVRFTSRDGRWLITDLYPTQRSVD